MVPNKQRKVIFALHSLKLRNIAAIARRRFQQRPELLTLKTINIKLSQGSVESGHEVVRPLRLKALRTIQTGCINIWGSFPNGKP